MALDTHPYRVNIAAYSHFHGLAEEEGASLELHGPLGIVMRRWLTRVQRHMKASGKFPKVAPSGILDEPTRAAFDKLYPKRPAFADEFRRIAKQDAANPGRAYYSQGSARWQGVTAVYGHVRVSAEIPELISGDCSAGYTRWTLWALEQSLGRVPRDVVNGASWRAGFTGTISVTCKRIAKPVVGCAALYGSGTFEHVTGVVDVEEKLCCSHGSNAGPTIERWDYRGDLAGFWMPEIRKA